MRLKSSITIPFLIIGGAISLAGCATDGQGTKQVTCDTMRFVWLSRQDTPGTIRQVTSNNGTWVALCGAPGPAPEYVKSVHTKSPPNKKPSLIDRWRVWRP
jgi:hypothetical protein